VIFRSAPATIPVSYPNRKLPKATLKPSLNTRNLLYLWRF